MVDDIYSIQKWSGLAKVGKYTPNGKLIETPALFPVVDPFKQDIPISDFKTKFGFDQVITSAYLMSKRFKQNYDNYPKVRDYLSFDGTIMMDSGAYQVMLYGDIDLGVLDTISLQKQVEPDIGVIMDHPIGYNVSFKEAKTRVETTINNINQSLSSLGDTDIKWTLPIQGGRYIELMKYYLDKVNKENIMDHFSMFALGSVVPIMINQDYETLIKMISTARISLPVNRPLHLFGAGHPAMFALATFLGVDTFDSAAYALMAKDGRYMTVEGTYDLKDLQELPCSCSICSSYTVKELLGSEDRRSELSKHNLFVSSSEIRRIKNAIRMNRLWDLVLQRANSVPKLARATRLAIKFIQSGKLHELYDLGVPVSSKFALRVSRIEDTGKIELIRVKNRLKSILMNLKPVSMIIIALDMLESIYNKLPETQINKFIQDHHLVNIYILLPPFGIVPLGLDELYPIGQLVHDLDIEDFDFQFVIDQLKTAKDNGLDNIKLIIPNNWPQNQIDSITKLVKTEIINTEKPMTALKAHFQDDNR